MSLNLLGDAIEVALRVADALERAGAAYFVDRAKQLGISDLLARATA